MFGSSIALGLFASSLSVVSAAQQTAPDLKHVIAAFESADSMLSAIQLEWQGAIGLSDFSAPLDGASNSESGLYYRKGNKGRWEVKASSGGIVRSEDICTYDGKAGKSLSVLQKEGVVVGGAPKSTRLRTIPIPTRARVWDWPLFERLKRDAVQLLEERKEIDGVSAYVLEGRAVEAPNQMLYRVYVDSEKGFMPLQIEEVSNAEGVQKVVRQMAYRGYHKEQDLWFPERVEETGIEKKDGTIFARNVYQVKELKTNIELKDELFDLTFPDGTRVHDSIANTDYIVGKAAAKNPATLRSRGLLTFAGVAVLLALLVVVLAVRQLKRSR